MSSLAAASVEPILRTGWATSKEYISEPNSLVTMRTGPAGSRPLAAMTFLIHSMLDLIWPMTFSLVRSTAAVTTSRFSAGRSDDLRRLGRVGLAQLGVVVVRHGGEHVAQARQAHLHVFADVAADVQAGVAADQVPAVVDVVGLRDLDVAATAAGRLEGELGALVAARLDVGQRIGHALARVAGGDLPAALPQTLFLGVVVKARAHARFRAGELQLHRRIAQDERGSSP